MSADLLAFVRARLDEDEETAQLADAIDPAPWYEDIEYDSYTNQRKGINGSGLVRAADHVGLWDREQSCTLSMTAATAVHVARQDPARILREVATKRRLLDEAFTHAAEIDSEWGCGHSAAEIERNECEERWPDSLPIVHLLGMVYADHPDYQSEWAPDAAG